MKTEEFQEFKSADVITVSALVAVIFAIITIVLARTVGDKDVDRAKHHASRLTQQILSSGLSPVQLEARPTGSERRPANANPGTNIDFLGYEGRISKDPWGQPYHYKVFHKESKMLAVVVWSAGPNQISDTSESDLRYQNSGSSMLGLFRGDDLGAIEMASN